MAFNPNSAKPAQQTQTTTATAQPVAENKFVAPMICTTESYGGFVGLRKNKDGKVIILNQKQVESNPKVPKKAIAVFAFNDQKGESATNFREFVVNTTQSAKLKEAGFDMNSADIRGTLCKIKFAVKNDANLPELVNLQAGYKDANGSWKLTANLIEYDKKEAVQTPTKPAPTPAPVPTETVTVEVNDEDLPF